MLDQTPARPRRPVNALRNPGGMPRGYFAGAADRDSSGDDADASRDDAAQRNAWDPSRAVLVVDDEAGIVESLEKIFRREGFAVITATDGQTGLDLLRRNRVGVLLCDLMMPGTSGMDLLKAAKTIAPETEVVLMTAYGTV
jgi:PleD family two-component response regulator